MECKLSYLSCCGTSFGMPLSQKVTAKPCSCFCIVSFVFWSFSRLAGQEIYIQFRNSEMHVAQSFACTFFQLTLGQREVPTSALAMHQSFALSEHLTPFPDIFFVHFSFSMHWKMCLWISAGWTFLVFKNPITGSTAQVAGILVVILNDYSDCEENDDTELCNTHYHCFVKSSWLPLWATFS